MEQKLRNALQEAQITLEHHSNLFAVIAKFLPPHQFDVILSAKRESDEFLDRLTALINESDSTN